MTRVARKCSALTVIVLLLSGLLHAPSIAAQSLLARISVPEAPERMAITPDGKRIYGVGRMENNVIVIDTALDVAAVIARTGIRKTGDWPDDIAISADGARVYVASGGLERLTAIDSATGSILADVAIPGNPSSLAVTPDGTKVYVANAGFPGGVAVVDTATFLVTSTLPIFASALSRTMVVHPNGSRVYVAGMTGVAVIDTATDTVVANVPANGWRMAISPDGSRLYVHSQFANRIDVVDTSTNTILAAIPVSGSGPDPEVIVITPDGKRVYATHFSGSKVSAIDAAGNVVLATIPFPSWPTGLAASPDNSTAFVTTFNSLAWVKTADNSVTATLTLFSDTITGEAPVVTPDSAKLYAVCGNTTVCVVGTGIETVRTVTIDIKPGDTPNTVTPRSHGVIPVALLGSADFDVKAVDESSLRFGVTGTEATPRSVDWTDVNGDGKIDLMLQFETRATGIRCGDAKAVLTGATQNGLKLQGTDSLRTVGCR